MKQYTFLQETVLYNTRKSGIQGKGNFAKFEIAKGINLGIGLLKISNTGNPDKDYKRFPICTFTNHSDTPNMKIVKSGKNILFVTTQIVKKDEELTVDYSKFDFEGKRDFVGKSHQAIQEGVNYELIDSPEKLMEYMNDIQYGYITNKGKRVEGHDIDGMDFFTTYSLQSPHQLIRSRLGVCWDQTELEREFFEKYIELPFNVYYLECKNHNQSTHTVLVFFDRNKCYYFEHSWFSYRGIHEFKNEREFLNYIAKKQIEYSDKECDDKAKGIVIHIMERPRYGISCSEFMDFAKTGKKVYEK